MSYSKPLLLLFSLVVFYAQVGRAQNSNSLLREDYSKSFTIKDTLFNKPYIDTDVWRDNPVRHRYVHGGFKGTGTRFSFYFPNKVIYRGHFFQYITPFPDSENLGPLDPPGENNHISSTINSGGYYIETNGGEKVDFAKPTMGGDPTIGAYRANAASAQFSKIVASEIYGKHKTFGYCYGGSGGAYRTVGGMENTKGVWDGAVACVMASPMAIPNVFSVRMHAMRILKNKFPQIVDALEPGGSGDIYAGLNPEEKAALIEVTKMGFPPQAWFAYKTMGIHGFVALYGAMTLIDPKYFEDFWKVPGYLGANPPKSLTDARIQKISTIVSPVSLEEAVKMHLLERPSIHDRGTTDLAWKSLGGHEGSMPVAFQLSDVLPDVGFLGGDLVIKSGLAKGKKIQLASIYNDKVVFGPVDPSVLIKVKTGDTVEVDNSNFLASQTYHRHQVPGKEYHVWDQFRDSTGKPIYPQRPFLLGPLFTKGASGVIPNGKFSGKLIVLESLWDSEALPWQADWYKTQAKEFYGDKLNDNFRLWYTDHANHADAEKFDPTKIVSYVGVINQALIDLSDWVEKGITPPASTNYKIVDGQVEVPPAASERLGIQPVVVLKVNSGVRVQVKTGKAVTFTAVIEVPPFSGKVIAAEWNFEGKGYVAAAASSLISNKTGSIVKIKISHLFTKPGTYFPTLRATSQRQGNKQSIYTRIRNLGRVRVVVE